MIRMQQQKKAQRIAQISVIWFVGCQEMFSGDLSCFFLRELKPTLMDLLAKLSSVL